MADRGARAGGLWRGGRSLCGNRPGRPWDFAPSRVGPMRRLWDFGASDSDVGKMGAREARTTPSPCGKGSRSSGGELRAMRHEKGAQLLELAQLLAGTAEGLTLDEMAAGLGAGGRTARRVG